MPNLTPFCALLCALLLFSCPQPLSAASAPQDFQQAENTFKFGDYKKAVELFRKLLYPKPGRLKDNALRLEAQKLLGLSYYYLYSSLGQDIINLRRKGKKIPVALQRQQKKLLEQSQFELLNYLAEEPDAKLSQLLYPPDLVAFFNKLRRINKKRMQESKSRRRRRARTKTVIIHAQIEKQVYHTPLLVAFLPCGVTQFFNGHPLKGSLFMAGCAASLGTFVGTYIALSNLQIADRPGVFLEANKDTALVLQAVHISALAVLGAVILAGYIDGAIFFQQVHKRESFVPQLPKLDPNKLRLPSAQDRLMFQQTFQ